MNRWDIRLITIQKDGKQSEKKSSKGMIIAVKIVKSTEKWLRQRRFIISNTQINTQNWRSKIKILSAYALLVTTKNILKKLRLHAVFIDPPPPKKRFFKVALLAGVGFSHSGSKI